MKCDTQRENVRMRAYGEVLSVESLRVRVPMTD